MRKKIILIIIFIIILCVCLKIEQINKKDRIVDNEEEYLGWNANYIWITNDEDNTRENEWVCFRKNFNIDNKSKIEDAVCRIAVDSKYWLYINGEIVVRDGQLKRGEKGNSIYYDKIDIEKYLRIGENNISILVWHFGKSGFSHIDSGYGTLLFQAQIGDDIIISDDTWKTIKNPAYLADEELTNPRLSESNIYYDSNLELDGWYKNNYDDSSWQNAAINGKHDDKKWGKLIKRDIPFFKYSDIKQYESQNIDGEVFEMKLPYNMQVIPYLKVKSNSNQKIIISNDKDFNNSENYGKITYITKPGEQEYESPAWINGDKIYYHIPNGVEIVSLGYRQTGYDTEMSGNFECDDETLNTLWQMANRTLYVNMRDTYMDCPDRERAMWIGDMSIDMEEAMYGLDTSANDLYEKCIKTVIGWKYEDVLCSVSPSIAANLQLPIQNLLSICSMYNYYEYTGNKEFLENVYPSVKDYMNLWAIQNDGLVIGTGNYYWNLWQWYDSQGETDSKILENMWYYYALQSSYKMAEVLNLKMDANKYRIKSEEISKALNENFWDGNGYKSNDFDGYDVRVNSIAVLSGIADESKYNQISEVIVNNYDNSTFMEKYVLEALAEMGKITEVQNRIKDRYSEMIEKQDFSTTLWEYWNNTIGSKNHAWSGGPLIIMSKYFAGIEPLKEGYSEISIKPNFGSLNKLTASVNTVKGTIKLEAEKKENNLILEIDVPEKTLVAVEKMSNEYDIIINNINIYTKGKFTNENLATFEKEDEKYVYLFLDKGKYNIISK